MNTPTNAKEAYGYPSTILPEDEITFEQWQAAQQREKRRRIIHGMRMLLAVIRGEHVGDFFKE